MYEQCGCDRLYDNAAQAQTICVKEEAGSGLKICRGQQTAQQCPSDMRKCGAASPITTTSQCADTKSVKRCTRFQRKGKCIKKVRAATKKCPMTCRLC